MKYLLVAFSALILSGCAAGPTDTGMTLEDAIKIIIEQIEKRNEDKPPKPTPEPPPIIVPPTPEPKPPKIVTEPNIVPAGSLALKYYKPTNGNRWIYYTYKRQPLLEVGDRVKVTVGTFTKTVNIVKRPNGSVGADAPGLVIKNSDVGIDRGIAVLIYPGYKGPYKPAYITIK